MKAAVLYGENDLRYQEVTTPHAKPGEVVVQVKACGICTTDVKILAGESTPRDLPTILGHEVAGLVHEVGDGVKGLEVGQRVAVYPIASASTSSVWPTGLTGGSPNTSVFPSLW